MQKSDLTLLILCGGKGTRAQGSDKPLLAFNNKSILKSMLDTLGPCVDSVLISANRNMAAYRAFGYPVQVDAHPFEGPLAALASCASKITTPWVVVCPGDNPMVVSTLVSQLVNALEDGVDMVLVRDSERVQPLYFLTRTQCLPDMQQALAEKRSMLHWIDTLKVRQVEIQGSFPNINSLEDLKKLELAMGLS